jgi:ubiquinone/menaquinone biosynthesis C-methylase UbiE
MKAPRVDYDAIAGLYDATPYRTKPVDPELLAFGGRRGSGDRLAVLDIGCGTGNQLIADRAAPISAAPVGLDRSLGMLRQARPRAPEIAWVQADAAALPFREQSFDFVSCQFALHHMPISRG